MLGDEDIEQVKGIINDSLDGLRSELSTLNEKLTTPTPSTPTPEPETAPTPEPVTPDVDIEEPTQKVRYVRRGLRKVAKNV